jgi:hypothetical protein
MSPESTMVTPRAATCWPICVARIEVFRRIVSPSMLWPKHSCTITPPQPLHTTTGYEPASGSRAESSSTALAAASSATASGVRSVT